MPTTTNGLRYPASNAAPNVPQDLQNLATDVESMINETWTAYTPVWTANGAGTQPTIGNGVLSGRWRKLDRYTGLLKIRLQAGSTTAYGTGTASNAWRFTLPSGWTSGAELSVLGGFFLSATDAGGLTAVVIAGTTSVSEIRADVNNNLIANGIFSGVGQYLVLQGIVELA